MCLELEANLETLATCFLKTISVRGVVQSVEAIRYKPEGRVYHFPMGSLAFFIDLIRPWD